MKGRKFRKKPVVIEAVKWTGLNHQEINDFIWETDPPEKERHGYAEDGTLLIKTLESGHGMHTATIGDMIIRGVNNDYYPCKPDIFEKTYEPVASTD